MILHVADTAVFIPSFIDLVNENFDPDNHFFWLDGGGKEYSGNPYPNVYLAPRAWKARLAAYSRLCSRLHAADKIDSVRVVCVVCAALSVLFCLRCLMHFVWWLRA